MRSKSAKNSHFGSKNASNKPKIGQNKYLSAFYQFKNLDKKSEKSAISTNPRYMHTKF